MNTQGGLVTFMHIPKTGGTTLHDILSRIYSPKQSVHIPASRMQFRAQVEAQALRGEKFLFKGHIGISEVQDIPGNFVFTFLREPVERAVSHYYYLKSLQSAKHYEYLNTPGTTIESFYALREKFDMDNGIVRYLSGEHDIPCGELTEKHLNAAIHALEHKIHFFGMQDHYDESLIMLATRVGWKLPLYRKKNEGRLSKSVSAETLEFLRKENHLDVRLYAHAQKLFAGKLAAMTDEEKKKLKRLRRINKLISLLPF